MLRRIKQKQKEGKIRILCCPCSEELIINSSYELVHLFCHLQEEGITNYVHIFVDEGSAKHGY